jgi:hypothetical protein
MEAKIATDMLRDDRAVDLVQRLDYDFSRFGAASA